MKSAKIIALSGLSTALAIIFIIVGTYIRTFDLSALFMSSLCVMLPLSKKQIKGAFLTVGATFILSLILSFVTGYFAVSVSYLLFFGFHPIINYYENIYKKGKILFILLKLVLFLTTLFLMYYILSVFVVEIEFLLNYMPFIIIIGGTMIFFIYDYIMKRFQTLTNLVIKRLKV